MVLEGWMACRLPCTRVSLLRLTAGVTRLLAGPGMEDPRWNPCAIAVHRIERWEPLLDRQTIRRSCLWGSQERWNDVTSRAWGHGTSWAGTLGQQVHSAHAQRWFRRNVRNKNTGAAVSRLRLTPPQAQLSVLHTERPWDRWGTGSAT